MRRIGSNIRKQNAEARSHRQVRKVNVQKRPKASAACSVLEPMVAMIMAQRAYEINSKAIQTADNMLQVANNIKR